MAKEAVNIADILKSLTLTSSEDRSLGISSNDLSTGIKSCRRSLIGRFFAAKEIVVKGLKLAIVKAWNCTHFSVVKLHRNTYQFVFDKEEDLHRILEGGPWSFDNYLLVLRRWKNDWDRDDSYFGECDFWIHVVGLPFYFITPSVGRRLAADFHNCSAIQIRVDSGTNQWLFRLRVTINVMQPLLRAVTLKAENDSKVTALIQYEWLPNVCYQCGHLDHTLKFCNLKTGEVPKSEFSRLPFGKWLGASRRTLLHIDVPLYENDINCPSLDISGNDIVREHKQGENSEQEVCVDSRSDLSETCSSKCLEEEEGDVVPDLDCSIKNTESITSLSQTSMDECREDNLFKAKLAQQAERYKEMVQFMKKVVSSSAGSEELSLEERDLLLVAYKHVIGATRASWRIIALIEQKDESRCNKGHLAAIRSYKTKIESELSSICEGILKLLDTRLIGSAMSGECKVLYLKMKGDHNRYLAEFKTGVERKEAAMNTLDAYKAAQDISNAELAPTHPIRLGLALNFSVFYYEILNSPDQACTIAAQAFQKAIAELGTLREAPLKDITLTLQLLCDNLTLWLSESPAGRRRQGHQGSRKT